jgi:hypothetical protein
MQLWLFVEPNDDTLSNDGVDEDDEAGRFDTTMEEDMKLNAAVGKGVGDGPSSHSYRRCGNAECMRTVQFGVTQMVVDRLSHEWESRRKSNPYFKLRTCHGRWRCRRSTSGRR